MLNVIGVFVSDVCDLQCPYDISGDSGHACADSCIPGIDFASFHLWLDNWGIKERREEFVSKWIKTHVAAAQNVLKLPIVLTEFNSRTNQLEHLNQVLKYIGIKQGKFASVGSYWYTKYLLFMLLFLYRSLAHQQCILHFHMCSTDGIPTS